MQLRQRAGLSKLLLWGTVTSANMSDVGGTDLLSKVPLSAVPSFCSSGGLSDGWLSEAGACRSSGRVCSFVCESACVHVMTDHCLWARSYMIERSDCEIILIGHR